ncbi:chitin disaccharide deacetylase [Bacillus sp. Au-Bac7]|uniref:chitin disaccharide deacetylase n=1 Tax=Bacillus sp. Au-Bac7 TaxID=2906458 RepID=UPI001E5BD9C4|nr:chitin disaccharide deacetylase [Bacillus sp. Au-Bac7]MCE4049792.1 chitin disaccharide deacetylase [Bacillus sp. Au-Bac7]
MIKLLVNADDFGFSRGVNYGILDTHLNGIVNSATMMMNAAGTEHALEIAKATPSLKVGVHLVLTLGKPLTSASSLIGDDGFFKKQKEVYEHPEEISHEDLEREWTAQIERFLAADLKPSHFDSHHHVHGIKEFYPVIKRLSEKYDVPVRIAGPHFTDIKTVTDILIADFYGEGVTEDYFEKLQDRVADGKTVEVMTHPAYLDSRLKNGSSYYEERQEETRILSEVKLPENMELL